MSTSKRHALQVQQPALVHDYKTCILWAHHALQVTSCPQNSVSTVPDAGPQPSLPPVLQSLPC